MPTGHVFGSNTSASSWDPLRRGIEARALYYFKQFKFDLVQKHRKYLDMVRWDDGSLTNESENESNASSQIASSRIEQSSGGNEVLESGAPTERPTNTPTANPSIVPAHRCEINPGIRLGVEMCPLRVMFYVDDGLMAAPGRVMMELLIASCIQGIFDVMGEPELEIRQCPVALDKWEQLIIAARQVMLGILIDSEKLTAGVTREYREECLTLLNTEWPESKYYFHAKEALRMVGKLARLGVTTPFVYYLLSQIYTSITYALAKNREFFNSSSEKFRLLAVKIFRRSYTMRDRPGREARFALKEAARMVYNSTMRYAVNKTMREEIEFIRHILLNEDVAWNTPIAHLIERTPAAKSLGDSCPYAGGGFSVDLKFIWNLIYPDAIVQRTRLDKRETLKDKFISINVLEFVVVIIQNAAAYTVITTEDYTSDPYPVVLNMVDNISAMNWTMHSCKSSIIGRRLARLFCGLLIGSPVGINAKYINTKDNKIADEISRMKQQALVEGSSQNSPQSNNIHHSFDFISLQQNYPELKDCRFFVPKPELISAIWEVLLNESWPNPLEMMKLRQTGLGRLTTSLGVGPMA